MDASTRYRRVLRQAEAVEPWKQDHDVAMHALDADVLFELGRALFGVVVQLDATAPDAELVSEARKQVLCKLLAIFADVRRACERVDPTAYGYAASAERAGQLAASLETMLNGARLWRPDDKARALAALDAGEVVDLDGFERALQSPRP